MAGVWHDSRGGPVGAFRAGLSAAAGRLGASTATATGTAAGARGSGTSRNISSRPIAAAPAVAISASRRPMLTAASVVSASVRRAALDRRNRRIHLLDAVGEHQVGREETLAVARVVARPSIHRFEVVEGLFGHSELAACVGRLRRRSKRAQRFAHRSDQRVDLGDPVVLALTGGDVAWMRALDFEECTGSGVSTFGESPRGTGRCGSFGLFLPHHVGCCGHDPDEQHVERETKGPAFHDRLPWLIVGKLL